MHEDLKETYEPDYGLCPLLKEGDVFLTSGRYGNSMPKGFCEYAWQAVQIVATSLAAGGIVFGHDYNIASCNDGIRPVIFKMEAVDE